MTLTLQDRFRGAIWGQFVGDAAALGSHWIYKLEELKQAFPDGIKGFETPQKGHYHFGRQAGDQTHYGDAALLMLESMAKLGRFDPVDFGQRLVELFGAASYPGYRDKATRETLRNRADFQATHPGKSFDFQYGADDDEPATISRLAPVVVAHWQDEKLLTIVKSATRVCQNNERAVAYNQCHALILSELFQGRDVFTALQCAQDRIRQGSPLGKEICGKINEALAQQYLSVTEATLKFGQACPLPKSFPSAIHCLARHSESFSEAILATIRAGGDNAGRAAMLGAWLGAALGIDAIPSEWREKLSARKQIEKWVEQLIRK